MGPCSTAFHRSRSTDRPQQHLQAEEHEEAVDDAQEGPLTSARVEYVPTVQSASVAMSAPRG
jgi:hypothetical protein